MSARRGASQLEEFKQIQKAVWEAGDYTALSPLIAHVGERLVEAAAVEAGMDVLDVACGTGNAARPAARVGATVTGLDLAASLLEAGRAAATEEGLEVAFVEGDAEQLPFADDSFDRVFSTFGHMFAPRHRRTAEEIARVCRPGGIVGLATWTPEGSVGQMFQATARFQPPPPDFAEPPILWGQDEYVRSMFPAASDFDFERHSATIEWESVDGFADLFMDNFPPMVMARQRLGEGFSEMRETILGVWGRFNEGEDGALVLPQQYLQSVIKL